jgi:hypothetical protein
MDARTQIAHLQALSAQGKLTPPQNAQLQQMLRQLNKPTGAPHRNTHFHIAKSLPNQAKLAPNLAQNRQDDQNFAEYPSFQAQEDERNARSRSSAVSVASHNIAVANNSAVINRNGPKMASPGPNNDFAGLNNHNNSEEPGAPKEKQMGFLDKIVAGVKDKLGMNNTAEEAAKKERNELLRLQKQQLHLRVQQEMQQNPLAGYSMSLSPQEQQQLQHKIKTEVLSPPATASRPLQKPYSGAAISSNANSVLGSGLFDEKRDHFTDFMQFSANPSLANVALAHCRAGCGQLIPANELSGHEQRCAARRSAQKREEMAQRAANPKLNYHIKNIEGRAEAQELSDRRQSLWLREQLAEQRVLEAQQAYELAQLRAQQEQKALESRLKLLETADFYDGSESFVAENEETTKERAKVGAERRKHLFSQREAEEKALRSKREASMGPILARLEEERLAEAAEKAKIAAEALKVEQEYQVLQAKLHGTALNLPENQGTSAATGLSDSEMKRRAAAAAGTGHRARGPMDMARLHKDKPIPSDSDEEDELFPLSSEAKAAKKRGKLDNLKQNDHRAKALPTAVQFTTQFAVKNEAKTKKPVESTEEPAENSPESQESEDSSADSSGEEEKSAQPYTIVRNVALTEQFLSLHSTPMFENAENELKPEEKTFKPGKFHAGNKCFQATVLRSVMNRPELLGESASQQLFELPSSAEGSSTLPITSSEGTSLKKPRRAKKKPPISGGEEGVQSRPQPLPSIPIETSVEGRVEGNSGSGNEGTVGKQWKNGRKEKISQYTESESVGDAIIGQVTQNLSLIEAPAVARRARINRKAGRQKARDRAEYVEQEQDAAQQRKVAPRLRESSSPPRSRPEVAESQEIYEVSAERKAELESKSPNEAQFPYQRSGLTKNVQELDSYKGIYRSGYNTAHLPNLPGIPGADKQLKPSELPLSVQVIKAENEQMQAQMQVTSYLSIAINSSCETLFLFLLKA